MTNETPLKSVEGIDKLVDEVNKAIDKLLVRNGRLEVENRALKGRIVALEVSIALALGELESTKTNRLISAMVFLKNAVGEKP